MPRLGYKVLKSLDRAWVFGANELIMLGDFFADLILTFYPGLYTKLNIHASSQVFGSIFRIKFDFCDVNCNHNICNFEKYFVNPSCTFV